MSEALATSPGRLTLSSPDAFLASIPHLIGFPPVDSVVIVGMATETAHGSPTIRLTQRFDRPPTGSLADGGSGLARDVAAPMIASGSTEVIITVFGDTAANPERELPDAALVDELINAFDDQGIGVRDALYTDGTSRWSYGCDNPTCCPPTGRVIPEQVRTLVAAEFALSGSAMVPSRQALADEIAPADADVLAEVAKHVATAEESLDDATSQVATGRTNVRFPALETWREESLATVASVLTREPASPSALAQVAVGLGDVRVRDTALWDLMQPAADPDAAIAGLTTVVRHAPDGHVAPAATVLAVCQWTAGDGARANAALQRAFDDNPEYSLAGLVRSSLNAGLPPQAWRDSLAGLTRDTCRHGDPRPAPQPAAAARPRPSIASPNPGLAL